jgi:hypothetical protein
MTFTATNRAYNKPIIKLNDCVIDYVDTFNYLGIIFDKNMNWQSHIDHIIKKISKTVGILKKLKHVLPRDILLTLYNTLINPHFTYGILCWKKKLNSLQKIQKRAVRVVACAKYNAHTEPIFKELKILQINDLCHLHELKLAFKIENKLLPPYFYNLTQKLPRENYNRRGHLYFIPRVRHEFAKYSLNYSIPITITKTDISITEKLHTHSFSGFAKYVKTKFLGAYRVDCNIIDCYICRNV